MTGGFAYVLDEDRSFVDRYNHELVDITRVGSESMEEHAQYLRLQLQDYVKATRLNGAVTSWVIMSTSRSNSGWMTKAAVWTQHCDRLSVRRRSWLIKNYLTISSSVMCLARTRPKADGHAY